MTTAKYQDQDEGTMTRARALYRRAWDADGMTDDEIDAQIVEGRIYCPLCGRWDCDMSCEGDED